MRCQSCHSDDLVEVLSLGHLPPPNVMLDVGAVSAPQQWLPTDLMLCRQCELVQLGHVAPPAQVFAPGYAYTSGSTRALHENFEQLYRALAPRVDDLVVDIGSNDGTLLSKFDGCRVLGVEPTDVADRATVPTVKAYFGVDVARQIRAEHGPAKLVLCTNCFAHIADVHGAIRGVLELLGPDGVFVTESHYLFSLLETTQYDTIYHEHLRYYSVRSLQRLLAPYGLTVFRVEKIPTHGGSIRAYAGLNGQAAVVEDEPTGTYLVGRLGRFAEDVVASKLRLMAACNEAHRAGGRICGIGAPSRAATVINYCRLDEGIIDCVYEKSGSLKIGKYMPGTRIPVVDEATLIEDQPSHAVLFSWHIGEELVPALRARGYAGQFIWPCDA